MSIDKLEQIEQSAYLRGWNDRGMGDIWMGVLIGVVVGLGLSLIVGWVT